MYLQGEWLCYLGRCLVGVDCPSDSHCLLFCSHVKWGLSNFYHFLCSHGRSATLSKPILSSLLWLRNEWCVVFAGLLMKKNYSPHTTKSVTLLVPWDCKKAFWGASMPMVCLNNFLHLVGPFDNQNLTYNIVLLLPLNINKTTHCLSCLLQSVLRVDSGRRRSTTCRNSQTRSW